MLRYLKGNNQFGLWYRQKKGVKLQGFTNADWERILSNRKRTSEGTLSIGSTIVSWYNKKQRSVAFSSTEEEYMATSQAPCEAI